MLKIATWNVNSLRVRLPQVTDWLQAHQPDVLAIQETKLQDLEFPLEAILDCGYQPYYAGQKTYNGVALLSRKPLTGWLTDIPGMNDPQRRVLGAMWGDIRILNLYVPNGSEPGSDKYRYKLRWLTHLQSWIAELIKEQPKLIVLGDFNIAPADIDVHDPAAWQGSVLVSPEERAALQGLMDLGLHDVYREQAASRACYSWWDYRGGAFRLDHGVRIDLILASDSLAAECQQCQIDRETRALDQPSDHAPVIAEFA